MTVIIEFRITFNKDFLRSYPYAVSQYYFSHNHNSAKEIRKKIDEIELPYKFKPQFNEYHN